VTECGKRKDLQDGRKIAYIIASHGLDSATDLHDYLIRMFTACGSLLDATLVFHKVEKPSLYTWNSIMSAHALLGDGKETISLFYALQDDGFKPSKFIFLSVLKSISKLRNLPEGKDVHSRVIRRGFENDIVVGSSLIDMYGKCGSTFEAHRVFETLPNKNVVSWNAMITGYVQQKQTENALDLFMKLQREGIQPTKFTLSCILKACDNIEQCEKIHDQVIASALSCDIVVGTALIDTYAKCGGLDHAHKAFNRLVEPDLACWNAIISGYAEHGHGFMAIELFEKMLDKVRPDKMTFSSVLRVIGSIGAIKNGRLIYHQAIVDCLEWDLILSNALIDMYAKCGSLAEAQKVLDISVVRDIVSWNTLISTYAQHGNCKSVQHCLQELIKEGLKPDERTFLSVLASCSHAGHVDEGREFFVSMVEEFGIIHGEEHLNCMIDLLGRAGLLKEAEVFLASMPRDTINSHGWTSLLAACDKYTNIEGGKQSFEKASLMNPSCGAGYVLLSQLCAGTQYVVRGNQDAGT
jgi:pentatricopeptide repeat protein